MQSPLKFVNLGISCFFRLSKQSFKLALLMKNPTIKTILLSLCCFWALLSPVRAFSAASVPAGVAAPAVKEPSAFEKWLVKTVVRKVEKKLKKMERRQADGKADGQRSASQSGRLGIILMIVGLVMIILGLISSIFAVLGAITLIVGFILLLLNYA
jgi:small-conductance mechanosensitive channel